MRILYFLFPIAEFQLKFTGLAPGSETTMALRIEMRRQLAKSSLVYALRWTVLFIFMTSWSLFMPSTTDSTFVYSAVIVYLFVLCVVCFITIAMWWFYISMRKYR